MMIGKRIVSFGLTVTGLFLLIYTSYRTVDFFSLTLSSGNWWLGMFALAALDLGLVLWSLYFRKGAQGAQRALALGMTAFDFLGVSIMFTADTLVQAGRNGLTSGIAPFWITAIIIFSSIVIAVNIAALIVRDMIDPKARREAAEEDALDAVETAAVKTISKEAPVLAAELAPVLAADYIERLKRRYLAVTGVGGGFIEGKARDAAPAPVTFPDDEELERRLNDVTKGNGHKPNIVYNAETVNAPEVRPLSGSTNGNGKVK